MSNQGLDNKQHLVIAAVIGVPVALAVAYWVSWKSYDWLPIEYQYVPGTITGWMSSRLDKHSKTRRKQRPIRVYMDGCFDLMHYGHANALRQARTLGDVLVVGVNPDSEIKKYKGPPVLNDAERVSLVGAVKWVDEVIPQAPYVLTPEFINHLFTEHKIDYIVHGDDPCLLPDGTDAYDYPKSVGRFRMVKRTEGVSTTDVVGRMLMCGSVNPLVRAAMDQKHTGMLKSFGSMKASAADEEKAAAETRVSSFLPTGRRIVQFANGSPPPANAKVVYIDGGFDLFHCGHLEILKKAALEGNFLIVGVHTDEDVQERRGLHLPIMSVHERSLSVMACKHVNEVIIGAPEAITADLIKSFNISVVVRGTISETSGYEELDMARYAYPKEQGMYRELVSPVDMTTKTIIKRIVNNSKEYEVRQAKKLKSEAAYYTETKEFVGER